MSQNFLPSTQGAADLSIQQAVTSQQEELVCKDLLLDTMGSQSLEQAMKVAEHAYPELLTNNQALMEFGKEALVGLNNQIDRLQTEIKPVDIPKLNEIMNQVRMEVRKVQGKYNMSDSKVRKKLENWGKGLRKWIGEAKGLIEVMREDALRLDQQLDRIANILHGKGQQILINVGHYDQLYADNEKDIKQVIYVIAVMEYIRDEAEQEIKSLQFDKQTREKSERARSIAEFKNNLEIKIMEYKNRLMVGWATSPQISNMRTLDIALAQKLDLLISTTIPTWKLTLLQWSRMVQTEQTTGLADTVSAGNNEALQEYFKASAKIIPQIARAVQTPSLTPETITLMATAIEQGTQGLIDAYHEGQEKRAIANDAIVKAQRVITASTDKFSREIVEAERRTVVTEVVESIKLLPPIK